MYSACLDVQLSNCIVYEETESASYRTCKADQQDSVCFIFINKLLKCIIDLVEDVQTFCFSLCIVQFTTYFLLDFYFGKSITRPYSTFLSYYNFGSKQIDLHQIHHNHTDTEWKWHIAIRHPKRFKLRFGLVCFQ